MESQSFASLAHIRILLLPVGSIQNSSFEKCAAEIRLFNEIRLGDIPADSKDERTRFMPSPLSKGHLHLAFTSHPPPHSHSALSLFRPSHFPLGVIGVATCSQTDSLSFVLNLFRTMLLDIFPDGAVFPLAKILYVFEESEENSVLNLGTNLPGLVVIPGMMGNKKLYIGTLLADLCSQILGEFARVVQTLETPLGNEYLNATLLPTLPPEDMPEPLNNNTKRDTLPPLPHYSSQPELSVNPAAMALKRNSSSGPGLRQTSQNASAPKRRHTGIGATSPHGRLFKVLGDFFLLSGRTEDAVIWYTEAIALLKTSLDAIWHASALEGVATVSVLDAWSAGFGLHTSFSNGMESWTGVSEKLTQAIGLYLKSTPNADAEQPYALLVYLYSSAVLRQASLLFSVWSSKGWGPLAFSAMVQAGSAAFLPPTLSHTDANSWFHLERLSMVAGISRSLIASVIAQAHGPWLLHLGPGERIAVLESMAGMYACLGYKRKEAYVLREVLGCVMDLLVCGREETETSSSNTANCGAGLGIHGVSTGEPHCGGRNNVGMRQGDSTGGNESILRIIKYTSSVLGVNLEAVKLVDDDATYGAAILRGEDGRHRNSADIEFADEKSDAPQDPHGWPELQVGVVREAIAVAEALPDHLAVVLFALSSLKALHTVLAPGDQHYLHSISARALTTARRRGDTKCVEFWFGRPIVNIAVSPLALVRIPIEKPVSAFSTGLLEISPLLPGVKDPFLYNPRKSAGQGQTLVVQNESIEFVVTLQNPFFFDLELQSLALSTSGALFESKAVPVTVPSNSVYSITIHGKALEPGILIIRGCVVRAPGGAPREFVLPLSTEEEERKRSRIRIALQCETGRTKYSGLQARSWERVQRLVGAELDGPNARSVRFLQCKVVEEQPLLRIRRTSLTHGALTLYNGEMSAVRIILENVSSLPIDFLRLSFDDSTIAPAQQALADGDLSVFDTYETEYDLIHCPVFTCDDPMENNVIVRSGQKVAITFSCRGKVGCTSGTIHVSYAYIHRPQPTLSAPADIFYTRQISYPIMVTVYHMLECHAMDIIPYASLEVSECPNRIAETSPRQSRRNILQAIDESAWCMFSIDVRNTYGLPFEVTIERNQAGTSRASTTSTVAPGSTTRIIIPLKKFLLSQDQIAQVIPTLSDRQFVVIKSTLSSAEDDTQREMFWYREELFKCIRGHWQEAGGTRSGNLSLRQQRLTLPMLETLRIEKAKVQLSLVRYNDNGFPDTVVQKAGKYLPLQNEFLRLRVNVTNLSPIPLVLAAYFNMEPSEHMIYDGVLSEVPIGRLESGESTGVELAICFLCYGLFEIGVEVRTLGAKDRAGASQLMAVVYGES